MAHHRNPTYQMVAAYLDSNGYSFEPHWGGKHPYVRIDLGNGRSVKFGFSGTASCSRTNLNTVRDLKRRLAETRRAA